jgi:hypothetical protein
MDGQPQPGRHDMQRNWRTGSVSGDPEAGNERAHLSHQIISAPSGLQ